MDVSVAIKKDTLFIQDKEGLKNVLWSKRLEEYPLNRNIDTGIPADGKRDSEILFWKDMDDNVLMVYIRNKKIRTVFAVRERIYLRVLPRVCTVAEYRLDKKGLYLKINLAVANKKGLQLADSRLMVGNRISQPFDLYVVTAPEEKLREESPAYIREFFFSMEKLTENMEESFSRIDVGLTINGIETRFPIKIILPEDYDRKYLAVPIVSFYYKNYAVQMKTSIQENVVFICRPKNPEEKKLSFQFWESDKMSQSLYEKGRKEKEQSSLKVNLFYEKFCEKAEEGTFELFKMARDESPKGAYFIINKNSPDYERIKNESNVVPQFSRQYYELLFRANGYISTETPIQVHMLQSNNKYFRKTIAENQFVFLQHGITYMKCQGKYSPFLAGREMEPDYMIVSSEKEKKVVHEMLGIDEERLLNTGMAIFSNLEYRHISEESEDVVVLMLTWKQYEDEVEDFTKTSCYQYTMKIFKLLTKYVPINKIRVVIHPKIKALLDETPLADNVWKGPISQVLTEAKLLITDYSSVCYNSFYQGGGVVFYQEDLDYYEKTVGKLIPSDEEYIGRRAFSMEDLDSILTRGIQDQRICLDYFRTKEFEENYRAINEFSDGKNTERIFEELKRLEIL